MREQGIGQARSLLNAERYREAANVLNLLIGKNKGNDELWYLRGLVSLKLKNYENAQECFERALWLSKKAAYHKIRGMAYMETYELEAAIGEFESASLLDGRDAGIFFYIAVCHMFLNNPLGRDYLEKAYALNKKKTKELAGKFYMVFFNGNPLLSPKIRKELGWKIERIPA